MEGLQGIKGEQGIQGNQGIKGSQGIQGIQGIKGIQGNIGINGQQGIKGDKGNTAEKGQKGQSGVSIISGDFWKGVYWSGTNNNNSYEEILDKNNLFLSWNLIDRFPINENIVFMALDTVSRNHIVFLKKGRYLIILRLEIILNPILSSENND